MLDSQHTHNVPAKPKNTKEPIIAIGDNRGLDRPHTPNQKPARFFVLRSGLSPGGVASPPQSPRQARVPINSKDYYISNQKPSHAGLFAGLCRRNRAVKHPNAGQLQLGNRCAQRKKSATCRPTALKAADYKSKEFEARPADYQSSFKRFQSKTTGYQKAISRIAAR